MLLLIITLGNKKLETLKNDFVEKTLSFYITKSKIFTSFLGLCQTTK